MGIAGEKIGILRTGYMQQYLKAVLKIRYRVMMKLLPIGKIVLQNRKEG